MRIVASLFSVNLSRNNTTLTALLFPTSSVPLDGLNSSQSILSIPLIFQLHFVEPTLHISKDIDVCCFPKFKDDTFSCISCSASNTTSPVATPPILTETRLVLVI